MMQEQSARIYNVSPNSAKKMMSEKGPPHHARTESFNTAEKKPMMIQMTQGPGPSASNTV